MESRSFLESLPDELLVEISTYFQARDFIAPGAAYRRFHNLFGDERKLACDLAYKLHTHVIRGEKDEAENLLKLFPSLLTVKGTVTDFSGRTIEGTALRIALGACDVYQEGKCDLIVVPPPFTKAHVNQLNLRSPAAYVRSGDKLFYIDKTNNEFSEIPLDQAVLMQFDAEMNPPQQAQTLSEDQLKNITPLTGHIHDEGMAQMLQRYLRKLPNGEAEIAKQTLEQFPEGFEKIEEERVERDSAALRNVIEAIAASRSEEESETAIAAFRKYLEQENKGKGVIKTGKHFNSNLLAEAFELYDKNYDRFGGSWDSPKNIIFWRNIIGSIQRHLPANDAQGFCQGIYSLVESGEKLKRSLKFRYDDAYFYPLDLDPRSRLGYECAVGRAWWMGGALGWGLGLGGSVARVFTNYVKQKTASYRRLMRLPGHIEKKGCAVM